MPPVPRQRWRFLAGCLLAVLLLGSLAEGFLRAFPPSDLHRYLGEDAPLSGPFRTDPDIAVAYRSFQALHDDYRDRLSLYLPWGRARPRWAFFGNSFIHAPGMLADTARARLTDRCIFNLGRNELLPVRVAQVSLLLEQGMAPQRLFFALMPVDVIGLGEQPLDTWRVHQQGAITYAPRRPPGPLGDLVDRSRLAFTAWARTGLHRGRPSFARSRLYEGLPDHLAGDLDRLLGRLARDGREHRVPVTLMLIPAYHQIAKGAVFGFQDQLANLARRHGLDVFDPRATFRAQPDPEGLFIPDKHFNDRGNAVLLGALLAHVRGREGSGLAHGGRP